MQKPNKFQALTQKTQIDGSPDGKERMDRQQAQINTQISVNQRQNPQQLNDKSMTSNQQSTRRKSQADREKQDDLNRSRRSSRSRVAEEDLPESYADLARRVYRMAEKEGWTQSKVMELLKNPAKLVKTLEHRKLEGFQKPLDPVIQRMIEDQEQRELKRQQLMDQQRKNEEESTMKSIMMAQSTSKVNKDGKARTHDEFMADQIKFEQQRFEKLRSALEKEEDEASIMYKPQLSQKSQKYAQKKLENAPQVHDRLYQSVKDPKIIGGDESQQHITFQPNINPKSKQIHRGEKIEKLLQDDAIRRREKKSIYEKQKVDILTEENKKKAGQSKKSQNIVFNRFNQDFQIVSQHHGLPEGRGLKIDYIKFENFCRDMGFFDDKHITKNLIVEMWGHLRQLEEDDIAEERFSGSVSIDDMKVFMAGLLGFNQPFMKSEDLDQQEERPRVNTHKIGHRMQISEDDENETRLVLTDEDIAYATKYFILLSAARQDYLMNSKKNTHFTKVVEQVPQSDFRPQTNAKSNKIIEKKNPKDEMGDLSYHDYLIQRGKQYQEKRNAKAQVKDGTTTDGCTFKPTILKKNFNNTTRQSELEGLADAGNKWQELYLMAQSKKNKDKADKPEDEITLEKNPEEFTFQPNAHKYGGNRTSIRASNAATTQRLMSPKVQKSEQRLHEVKSTSQTIQQRENSQPAPIRGGQFKQTLQYSSQGTTSTQYTQQRVVMTSSSSNKQLVQQTMKYEQVDHDEGEEPLLYVDVNLGSDKTRIALYQRSNPQLVAQKFVQDHGLDVNILENLTNLLTEQLSTALHGIDEEDVNSSDN